jgi:pantoate--beta-alanine ligase
LKVVRSIAEIREHLRGQPSIGFVPTMGFFHEGHLTLMRQAKQECGYCVVSIFVNPLQFGPTEDLSKYPRDEQRDLRDAESVGVDLVFAPTIDEIRPPVSTKVIASRVSELWEGQHRPGHFDGVATIVAKLFNIVQPTDAFFGTKDLQQFAVVNQLIVELGYPIRLHACETVRESSGLALSSRNSYFTPQQRADASFLYKVLTSIAAAIRSGGNAASAIAEGKKDLEDNAFSIDYLACVDSNTMQSDDKIDKNSRLIAAVRFCGVRLIDNVSVLNSQQN